MATAMTPTARTSPLTVDGLHAIMEGYYAFQILRAAVKFDLFTVVGGGISRDEIVRRVGLAERPTRILLLGCVSLGLLHRDGDTFRCSDVAKMTLTADSPWDQRSLVAFGHEVCYRAMWWLAESLQQHANVGLNELPGTESTLYGRLAHHPEAETAFHNMMATVSSLVAQQLVKHIDLSQAKTLVDVGGGTGANAMPLARRFPQLRVTIFDLPSVVESASDAIARAGLSDRISTVAGDCFEDELPVADRILFAHFLEIWSPQEIERLLARAARALSPGGEVLLINMIQDDDERGPVTAGTGSAYFQVLASGRGMVYTWSEYETWLRHVGLTPIRRCALTPAHGLIIARN